MHSVFVFVYLFLSYLFVIDWHCICLCSNCLILHLISINFILRIPKYTAHIALPGPLLVWAPSGPKIWVKNLAVVAVSDISYLKEHAFSLDSCRIIGHWVFHCKPCSCYIMHLTISTTPYNHHTNNAISISILWRIYSYDPLQLPWICGLWVAGRLPHRTGAVGVRYVSRLDMMGKAYKLVDMLI